MADRLTQLQDATEDLITQFIASIYYVNKHHELRTLGPTDIIRQENKSEDQADAGSNVNEVEPYPADVFKAGQLELAQDLIVKEQQIEYLISVLPGLENSEKDQEEAIKQLEEELKAAEEERKTAHREKQEVLAKLEKVIRSVRRP